VERRANRGKTFYGCNRWPECNFVALGQAGRRKISRVRQSVLMERWLKAGAVWQCPNAECKHKQEAPQPVEALVR
jgi:ssDNA-binding Zn-finger/Zn-ribbon topoisomerase 1